VAALVSVAAAFGVSTGSQPARSSAKLIGAQPQNKVYDGTANATVDFSGVSLNGIVGSDDVSIDTSGGRAGIVGECVAQLDPCVELIQPAGVHAVKTITFVYTGP